MQSYYRETAQMIMNGPRHLTSSFTAPILTPSTFYFDSKEKGFIKNIFKKQKDTPIIQQEPESVNMHINDTVSIINCFSGADVVVSINDKVCAEVTGVHYNKIFKPQANFISLSSNYYDKYLIKEYPVTVVLEYTIFDSTDIVKEIELANENESTVNITMTYANEHGDRAVQSILDCILIEDLSGITVDSITRNSQMILAAREVTPMEKN